ncbi:MAG: MarR family transcriptional regulator [Microthrixaceae bacterium]|nr:MarR family transcriptional regulator [Microthrixaceae bacterium]
MPLSPNSREPRPGRSPAPLQEPAPGPGAGHGTDPVAAVEADLVLLMGTCSSWMDEQVLEEVRRSTRGKVRHSDGYVFQHLTDGPRRVTELAELLGVSQQAASKQVADMAERGLLERHADPLDRRARAVVLSPDGREAVRAARSARADVAARVREILGPDIAEQVVGHLRELAVATGALEDLTQRRRRPEGSR